MVDVPTPVVNEIGMFLRNNILWIGLLVVAVILIIKFVNISAKKPKIISRAQVERQRRIEELKYSGRMIRDFEINPNNPNGKINEYIHLWHGKKYLGEIKNIVERQEGSKKFEIAVKELELERKIVYEKFKELDSNNISLEEKLGKIQILKKENEEIDKKQQELGNPRSVFEIVFYPVWLSLFGLNLKHPKKDILRVYRDCVILDNSNKNIVILPEVSIDSFSGFYYDVPNETTHINWINDQIFKHDKEDTSAFYYVESQKRSTFDIDFAHELALKEKEIQHELAKKRGRETSI